MNKKVLVQFCGTPDFSDCCGEEITDEVDKLKVKTPICKKCLKPCNRLTVCEEKEVAINYKKS